MIRLRDISYSYPGTPAIVSVSADINSGITAVIGAAGSGKSTLCEIISGITAPDTGTVTINGKPAAECTDTVGMVFQYPEHQLFAETVYDDIAFGPKNLGLTELDARVKAAAKTVGLKPELFNMDPFLLSGGEKRLAAIAGILAMEPRVLILDEPAAGLDPRGKKRIFDILKELKNADADKIIVFVTHSMDDAAEYADNIILLENGKLAAQGTPREVFDPTTYAEPPEIVKLAALLAENGIDIGRPITEDEAYAAISALLSGGARDA